MRGTRELRLTELASPVASFSSCCKKSTSHTDATYSASSRRSSCSRYSGHTKRAHIRCTPRSPSSADHRPRYHRTPTFNPGTTPPRSSSQKQTAMVSASVRRRQCPHLLSSVLDHHCHRSALMQLSAFRRRLFHHFLLCRRCRLISQRDTEHRPQWRKLYTHPNKSTEPHNPQCSSLRRHECSRMITSKS